MAVNRQTDFREGKFKFKFENVELITHKNP